MITLPAKPSQYPLKVPSPNSFCLIFDIEHQLQIDDGTSGKKLNEHDQTLTITPTTTPSQPQLKALSIDQLLLLIFDFDASITCNQEDARTLASVWSSIVMVHNSAAQ